MSSPEKNPQERLRNRYGSDRLRTEEEISRFVSEGGDSATYASAADVPTGTLTNGVRHEP